MTCVEVFQHRDAASEAQRLLRDRGLEARVFVDPLESLAPALATYHGVVLCVRDDQAGKARDLLGGRGHIVKKAG